MSSANKFVCTTDFATSDIVLGFLLSIGIFLSFLPQILVLIFRKNVEGLSVISCWFNYANCMGTFLNSLFLNWFVFECCHDWMTHWVCFENLLPVVQMAVPFVTTGLIFALYVIFRPKLPPLSAIADAKSKQAQGVLNAPADAEAPEKQQVNISGDSSPNGSTSGSSSASSSGSSTPFLQNENHDSKKGKRELSPDSFLLQQGNNKIERFFIRMDWYSQPFFWGTNIATVIFFGIGVALCYSYGSKSNELSGYAFAMGVMAAILVFFQWLPQIYTTWISDEIGSLSLVSLCIQVPGALLVCYFQLSLSQSWITWFPYLATAVQEIVLIVICAYYLIRDRKKRKAEEAEKKAKEEQEKSADYYQSEPPKPEYSEDNKDQPNNQNGSINNDIDIDTSINNQDQNNSSNNNSNSNINNQLTSNNSYENKNIILDGSSAALVENDTISTNFVVESKSIESDPKENENSEFHRDDHINGTDSIEMFSVSSR